ncbi:MAG: T9SS type A sorting domain-containing protein, partial [Flavobacteriales bacterium]
GNDWDFCKQATALSDGGFALFGQSYTSGNANFKLVRINSHGDTLWTKSYGGAGFESGESIDTAADGGFYLAGITESFGAGAADMYVVKTDDVGDTLWTKTFGDVEDDFCYGVGATSDTGYVLVGATFNNTADQSDFIIRKEGGSSQWIKHEATPGGSTVTDVLIEPGTGDVTVVGYVQAGDFGKEDGRIVRYGGLDGIWGGMAKSHGSQENDRFYDVKLCSDGGYVMVGTTAGYLNRFDDVYLVRGDEFGLTVNPELGVDEIEIDGKNFSVAIGPNPITENSALLIQDYVGLIKQVEDDLHVSIYNSIGVEIQRIEVNSEKANLNLGAVESGIYFYQLSTGNKVLATGKTIKID